MRRIACLALCFAPALAQAAHQAPDLCEQAPPPPEPWTSWLQSGAAIAGGEARAVPRLILGKPVAATLRPVAQVQFPAPPANYAANSYGGLFALSLKMPARVGIGLSGSAWVEAVTDEKAQAAVGQGPGPECSGIHRIVWFDLPAGIHQVQIANAPAPHIRIMAADARANRPLPRASAGNGF